MAGSIREALEQAYEKVEESGEVETDHSLTPIVDEPVVKALDSTTETPVVDEPVVPDIDKVDKIIAKAVPKKGEPKQTPPAKDPAIKPEADKAAPVAPKLGKAPQSWKPALREQFNKLPAEMQSEILRRENETGRVLSESATSRKFHQDFAQIVRPFEHLIAASNVHPLVAVRNLMSTAATLQTGTPIQRAGTIANLIKAYGVDIPTLDQLLSGQQPKPEAKVNDQVLETVRRELAPIREFINGNQRQQAEAAERLNAEAAQTIEQFAADPANEYYEDLKEDMADLLDMATNRHRVMTIQEAYDRAAAVHPEISKLVAKKKALAAASANKGNVERARRAAVSQPSGSPGNVRGTVAKPVGTRAAIAQAFDDLSAA